MLTRAWYSQETVFSRGAYHALPRTILCSAGSAAASRCAGRLDAAPCTADTAPYAAIAQALTGLGMAPALARLFQVDLVRPAPEATLGYGVVDEIVRGVALLRRLGRSRHSDPLERFRDAFLTRYEGRAVQWLETP